MRILGRVPLRPLLSAVVVASLFYVLFGASSLVPGWQGGGSPADGSGSNPVANVLLGLLLMLVGAKLGGELMERMGQPAVIGELCVGILLGNIGITNGILADAEARVFLHTLAEVGVIVLLFEVGLESTVGEMLSVGVSSLLVAIIGVVAPMGLGYLVCLYFLPQAHWTVHLFMSTVLAATSVGITARVLADMGRLQMRETKVILGAAVVDDILGLVVLAMVQGITAATARGETMSVGPLIMLTVKALGFFVGAVGLGLLISPKLYHFTTYLRGKGVLLSVTLAWCFGIAYVGMLMGVAPIVGAFAAGLVLERATFRDWEGREKDLEDLLHPIATFLVPIFFVFTGMGVKLETFTQVHVLGFALSLTVAAIVGKQLCALGVREKGLNRLAIGVGMIPRGEVGLIVANVGHTLKAPDGTKLISDDAFTASVIMVVLTTLVTPPVLKVILDRGDTAAKKKQELESA